MSACSVGDAGDTGSIPGLGRSLGRGNGNPHHTIILAEWARGAPAQLQAKGLQSVGCDRATQHTGWTWVNFSSAWAYVCVCVCVCVY